MRVWTAKSGEGGRLPAFFAFFSIAIFCLALGRPVAAEEAAPLRLCADPDNLPFSSASETTPGFYIELGREIARELGRPFEPVWVPTFYTKRQIRKKMFAGQCDGFLGLPDDSAFMGPRLLFSHPIIHLGYALVTPAANPLTGLEGLRGRRVAVQLATPPQDFLASDNDVRMVTVLSAEEGMQDLVAGKADAAFIWGPSAGWVNKTVMQNAYRIVPVEGDHMQWTAAIGFPRDRSDLRDEVDRALDNIGSSIDVLAAKYGFPSSTPLRLPAAGSAPESEKRSSAIPAEGTVAIPSASEVAAGHKLFNQNCSHCHGPDAVQGEQRRNLRLLSTRYGEDMARMFLTTVTHGRVTKGMPNWSGILSDDEFRQILAFLSSVQDSGS